MTQKIIHFGKTHTFKTGNKIKEGNTGRYFSLFYKDRELGLVTPEILEVLKKIVKDKTLVMAKSYIQKTVRTDYPSGNCRSVTTLEDESCDAVTLHTFSEMIIRQKDDTFTFVEKE